MRVDPERCLVTLLLGLGLVPACDPKTRQESGAKETSEPSAKPRRRRAKKVAPVAPEPSGRTGGRFKCSQSFPVKVNGIETGVELCAGGYHHRVSQKKCDASFGERQPCKSSVTYCESDDDCTGQPRSFCRDYGVPSYIFPQGAPRGSCSCDVGCTSDADCDTGRVCLCDGPMGRCVISSCRTDEDCPKDMLCAETSGAYSEIGFACQSPADACMKSSDCGPGERCAVKAGVRTCLPPEPRAIPGRPFLVEGAHRTAEPVSCDAWGQSEVAPRVAELSAQVRRRLLAHWTQAGLMEHASVAAFSRFSLQLLALGAPARLLEEAQRAAADEVRHARSCFALASAYGGFPVGPGRLDVDGALGGANVEEVLRTVFREGCVGETVAALEAEEAAAHAEDPAVAEMLRDIAKDELRHAELAWRFVAWALGGDAKLAEVVRDEVGALDTSPNAAEEDEDLVRYGVLGGRRASVVKRRAIADVVIPCASAVLEADSIRLRSTA